MKKIAFICVHNSCRSQMAEAICAKLASDSCECYLAGSAPSGVINPNAVRIIKQIYGIDMSATQRSKGLDELSNVDIAITMGCGDWCPNIRCDQ